MKRWKMMLVGAWLALVCLTVNGEQGANLKDKDAENVVKAVKAFADADGHRARERAKRLLTMHKFSPRLQDHATQLIPLLKDYEESEDSCLILGRLELPEDLKKALLLSKRMPGIVRARLANGEAEKDVISRFWNASRVSELRKRGEDLLYVGSAQTLREFSKALESRDVMTDVHGISVSRVLILMQCYRNVDPGERLLSYSEISKHLVQDEGEFAAKEHQDYLKEIRVYFREELGRDVDIHPPYLRLGPTTPHEYKVKIKGEGAE